jgi:hypothetical protein
MIITREKWRPIPGYESSYEASNWGRIRNVKKKVILRAHLHSSGYRRISITNAKGERKTIAVHRLVAATFVRNAKGKATVNHKDHDPTNNNVQNLEWMSVAEQNHHKRKVTYSKQRLISSRAVWRLDRTNGRKKIERYETIRDAAAWVFNCSLTKVGTFMDGVNIKSKICACCRGKRKTAYTYAWEYDDTSNQEDDAWFDISPSFVGGSQGYQISKSGKIKNRTGRVSHGFHKPNDYVWVSVCRKHYLLHILMAKVFIKQTDTTQCYVNHKDCDKTNANVENLEWCTASENMLHAIRHKKNR